jgi:organic hydroperoxide reductase OsmC/OhrA
MGVVKEHTFPVSIHHIEGRLTRASAPSKPDLEVATPPEFRGGIEGVWSPEDLLVASAASCFTVTLTAVAEAFDLPLWELDVDGIGHVTKREDGRFGFIAIQLIVELATVPGREDEARVAVERAEERCLIAAALDVPVHVELVLRSTSPALAGA